ncbi:MAG: alpha/beta hydrolase [Pseudomonadales bacterium]
MQAASAHNLSVVTERRQGRDVTINVRDYGGTGPVALLHHANGFSAGTWALVADRLIDHFRVFAIDARGHGDSDATGATDDPDLSCFVRDEIAVAQALCRRCGTRQIAYGVGSSFGGVVTAVAAARRPGLFERIAMLDPPIFSTPELKKRFDFAAPTENEWQGPPIEQTKRRRAHFPSLDEARASWRTKGMFAQWPDTAFELYLAECLRPAADGGVELKCSPLVEAHVFAANDNMDVLDYAPAVAIPVLYVRARKGFFPAAFCEGVSRLFPDCRYDEIDGGHLLPLEAPDAVVDRLLDFAGIKRTSARA